MDKERASAARRDMRRTQQKVGTLVEELMRRRKEITVGKVTDILTKCGRSNCRCTRGERHVSHFLYVSRGGPLQRVYVRKNDVPTVRTRSERYVAFRRTRAELAKACKQLLNHVDVLEAALTEPYEKGKPTEGKDG